MSWTEARVRHFLNTVMLGQVQIEQGPIGEKIQMKSGSFRCPWGYIITDKARPGQVFKGRTPKQAAEAAGITLVYISGYKYDK